MNVGLRMIERVRRVLDLELTQSQMTQRPVLWAEDHAHAIRESLRL